MKSDERCGDCGKLLALCRCGREYVSPPGAVANSRLGSRKRLTSSTRLRSRSLEERYGDDDLRYGPLFDEIKVMTCFAREHLPDYPCGPGYRPATAHHLGETDPEGQVPACGRHHDWAEEFPGEVDEALREAGSPSLDELGRMYVKEAALRLIERGEMTDEIREAVG